MLSSDQESSQAAVSLKVSTRLDGSLTIHILQQLASLLYKVLIKYQTAS